MIRQHKLNMHNFLVSYSNLVIQSSKSFLASLFFEVLCLGVSSFIEIREFATPNWNFHNFFIQRLMVIIQRPNWRSLSLFSQNYTILGINIHIMTESLKCTDMCWKLSSWRCQFQSIITFTYEWSTLSIKFHIVCIEPNFVNLCNS